MKIAIAAITCITLMAFQQASDWTVNASKVRITFKTNGTFGEINGSFSGFKATIKFDEDNLGTSSIAAYIDPKTIETGVSLRNSHLSEKEEYLNGSKYPLASFTSKQIQKTTTGYRAIGDMTIKGVTKLIEIPFTFTKDAAGGVFKGQFSLNALDYKVGTDSKLVAFVFEIPVTK
jgi:polyisoprenoid-binding protein YceI